MNGLKWEQRGDNYELHCPCCALVIAIIYKAENKYEGFLRIGPVVNGGYGPPIAVAKTFAAVRPLVNARIQELLNK